jgi:methylenetetrahydrofolate dehydrogenase (NADP+)/methenyltetrahydrofolate cyclohydrolase
MRRHMTARLIDGRALAARIKERLHAERRSLGREVKLASVRVGDSDAADLFMKHQQRACEEVGIRYEPEFLPASLTEDALIRRLGELNADPTVTGIIVQRPLPQGFDNRRIQGALHPDKDVEGLHPQNLGSILYREPLLAPCTALGAQEVILSTGVDPRGAEAVVVGHSEIVGKPIGILLLHRFATVTVCHVETRWLAEHTRRADILIVAVGKPGLVHGGMIKPGAMVVDIGINRVESRDADGTERKVTVGDVDFASAERVAGWLTPVPGGVGPVTVAMLLRNTLRAAHHQA